MKKQLFGILILIFAIPSLFSQDIQLPAPIKNGGMPLMEALNNRASTREFNKKSIELQTLSNLLWAAWGYNRTSKRTAPSSRNLQEMDLYIVIKTGVYIYDAKNNLLIQVSNQDVRKHAGTQDFVATAPLHIAFVANTDKGSPIEESHANAGFISQNIYLLCASENLSTVVRASFDKAKLSKALLLKPNQRPIYVQTIGGRI